MVLLGVIVLESIMKTNAAESFVCYLNAHVDHVSSNDINSFFVRRPIVDFAPNVWAL